MSSGSTSGKFNRDSECKPILQVVTRAGRNPSLVLPPRFRAGNSPTLTERDGRRCNASVISSGSIDGCQIETSMQNEYSIFTRSRTRLAGTSHPPEMTPDQALDRLSIRSFLRDFHCAAAKVSRSSFLCVSAFCSASLREILSGYSSSPRSRRCWRTRSFSGPARGISGSAQTSRQTPITSRAALIPLITGAEPVPTE